MKNLFPIFLSLYFPVSSVFANPPSAIRHPQSSGLRREIRADIHHQIRCLAAEDFNRASRRPRVNTR
ncbi:MAG: hypothetical protein ACKV2V_01180 [Blastocatellia bacterium]